MIERKTCEDCGFALPLKQFALYKRKRHPLCRTCLAIDVAEFKAWVLPFVQERRATGDAPWHWEDWEVAVLQRKELSGQEKSIMTLRPERSMFKREDRRTAPRHNDPAVIRPWKYALVDA